MNTFGAYFKRLSFAVLGRDTDLTLIEQILFGALVLMLAITAVDAFNGQSIGSETQLQMAKQETQQGLMAQDPLHDKSPKTR